MDLCVIPHGMMEYWNSADQKRKERIYFFLPVNPSFQYSIIPIFQLKWEQR
jgi:hypothetical protein